MQKFENVDILKSLKAIMQTLTEHFQSDFDIDIKTLKQAAKSPNPEDKKYLWICRPAGTWCLRERDTFIKGSREHNTFCFYAEQTRDKILAYAVELTGIEKGRVTGNLYELDYQKHYEHVKDASIDPGATKLMRYLFPCCRKKRLHSSSYGTSISKIHTTLKRGDLKFPLRTSF